MRRSDCVVVLVCLWLVNVAGSARGATPQKILSIGDRMSAGSTTMYVNSVHTDPEINDAGQIVGAVELSFVLPGRSDPDQRQPIASVVLCDVKKSPRVIAYAGQTLPAPNSGRIFKDVRTARLSQDGSVLFEATLGDRDATKHSSRDEPLSLWLWREGKLHLLLTAGESVAGHPELAHLTDWRAVVAKGGIVTAIVRPQKGGSNPSLVWFKDGKVEQVIDGKDAQKNAPGVSFGPALDSAGDNTIVVQKFHPKSGLGGSRVCRIVGDDLQPIVTAHDNAPEHMTGAMGGGEEIGSMEAARVTPAGRVLVFTKPGTKKGFEMLQAILASEENFGALHTLAMMGNKKTYPDEFNFQNLMNEPEDGCIADDSYAMFMDPSNQNPSFFLASPDGKLEKIMSMDDLPGLKGVGRRTVWCTAIATSGLVTVEIMADRGDHSVFSFDPKRKARRVVGKGVGLPDARGELAHFARPKDPRSPMTSDGRYVFAWIARVPAQMQSGGIAVIDLKK